jgi:hypothetical protein
VNFFPNQNHKDASGALQRFKFPGFEVTQLLHKSCACVILTYLSFHETQRAKDYDANRKLMLPPVLWIRKSYASDPVVSCLI